MEDYIQGLEDGVGMVKQIMELSYQRREELFGSRDIGVILNKFDFAQMKEKLSIPPKIKHYYELIIVADKSTKVSFDTYPTDEHINNLLDMWNAEKIIINEVCTR